MAKQHSVHFANSIWRTAHALSEFARAKKQQYVHYAKSNKLLPITKQTRAQRRLSALDSVLPCGGCEPLWVCVCLCGPPLRCATTLK